MSVNSYRIDQMPPHYPASLEQQFAAAKSQWIAPDVSISITENIEHDLIIYRDRDTEIKNAVKELIYFYANIARRWDCQFLCFTYDHDRQIYMRVSVSAVEALQKKERRE